MRHAFLICTTALLFHFTLSAQKSPLDSLYNLAWEKSAAGDVPGATAFLLSATKIAEENNNVPMQCKIQIMMGKLDIIAENNQGAEQATQQALRFCTACQDTASLARLYLQKGILKIKYHQNDSAIVFFNHSAAYYMAKKDSMGAANVEAKIGNVLEEEGQYKEAQPYYLKFYETTRKNPESGPYLTANIYLTGNYLYLKQFEKAFDHNQVVKQLSLKLKANYEFAQALRYDALILKNMGRFEAAFDELYHYTEYYQDTLMNKMQLEQAEELKARYEAEKKEAQIALQQAELGRERLRLWALIGILVMALVAGALLFRLTRQLRKRNVEKEFLIKEIHHRVKNNLQILSSLLHLQSRQITDDTALHAVREGQNRVDAMGLIHQKLYMGENVAKVEMKGYLEQFGQNMLDSFGIEDSRVGIEYEVEPLYLDVDTAIPLGLIINELVTNSLKYAFPNGHTGIIRIALWENEQKHLCLKVSDNGVGQSNAQRDAKSTSFGTNLVQMLSKKLKGTPKVLTQEQGYATLIVFEKWA